jgi:hypothetical protein
MRRFIRKPALLAAVAIATAILTTATPAQADSTVYGCPAGAVCIYNGASPDTGIEPGAIYWTYGPHNLHNQYGDHAVINNQTGGAWLTFCEGYNGTGPWSMSEAPNASLPPSTWDYDLTTINSIILSPGYHASCP